MKQALLILNETAVFANSPCSAFCLSKTQAVDINHSTQLMYQQFVNADSTIYT